MRTVTGLIAGLCLLTIATTTSLAKPPHVAHGKKYMVASVCQLASEAGAKILEQGGNAVDAAIVVALVEQVTWPEAGNIGGGGFMMVHPKSGEVPVFINYREKAPLSASKTLYSPEDSTFHAKAVGVPGTIRGLELAHQQFGTLPWRDLVEPAFQLADRGFAVDRGLADSLNRGIARIPKSFSEFYKVYSPPQGEKWNAGDILKQPDLAKTMKLIRDGGPDAFYTGEVADLLVAEMQRSGGIISKQDLAEYRAQIQQPVHFKFRGYDLYGAAPPSSGGIGVATMMQMWEKSPVKNADRWSPESIHFRAESMRRAFLDRALYIGDPDFTEVPTSLTSAEHAAELAKSIDMTKATVSRDLAPELFQKPESESTTHFSVIDGNGMSVSNTYTLEESFGSRVVVTGAGFLLNNEMGDFNWFPGVTNDSGRIGTEANTIAPGKRMLSSMSPFIVLKNGETVLVAGSPGGRTIINTVYCVLMNVLAFDLDLPKAVAESRMHHQWLPDKLQFERAVEAAHPRLADELRSLGHTVDYRSQQGDVHAISRNPITGELVGVADTRLSGYAKGDVPVSDASSSATKEEESLSQATFGNGCFWCTEAVFLELKGVSSVVSGYAGGAIPNPTYEQVCTGRTGHAEVIRIEYDPKVVSFETLLTAFFASHDPTTLNRQGADVGTQYRSVIFYHNDEQKKISEGVIAALTAAKQYRSPIVTEVSPLPIFYKAENYHQNYFALNGSKNPYCNAVIAPKIAKFRKDFKSYLKSSEDK